MTQIAFSEAFIPPSYTLAEALKNLNQTGFRTSLVVDTDNHLLGLVADYDIRCALLHGVTLNTPVTDFMNQHYLTASDDMTPEARLLMMEEKGIDVLPVVNANGQVVDVVRIRDFVRPAIMDSPIVIMAGGYGKRLMPLTANTPKPLLPIGDKPLLGHTLDQIIDNGFQTTYVTTHYLAEQIEEFVQTYNDTELSVHLVQEDSPTGTAGSLKKLDLPDNNQPIFVMNGDILTQLDFAAMHAWHREHGNTLTMASCYFQYQVPYGVFQIKEGQVISGIQEKPVYAWPVNAGIYLLDPVCLSLIPDDQDAFDMPDLIQALLLGGFQVGNFPLSEYWRDIGQHQDYEQVNEEYLDRAKGRQALMTGKRQKSQGLKPRAKQNKAFNA